MLSLIVAFSIQGVCEAKAIADGMSQFAGVALLSNLWSTGGGLGAVMLPLKTSTSPRIAARSKDLPAPVGPVIILSSLFGNWNVKSRSVNRFRRASAASSSSSSISSFGFDFDGKVTVTLSNVIESQGYVFSGLSSILRKLSIRSHDTLALMPIMKRNGTMPKILSSCMKIPKAVNATEGISSPCTHE
jgi:hypothetical protein